MKIRIIDKLLLIVSLMFVLVGGITPVRGDSPENVQRPVATIYSTGDVKRGEIGSFVVNMNPPNIYGESYVNFLVSGTAIPDVDYVSMASPLFIGESGYGTMLLETLPDPRGTSSRRAYSVVVTLKPGPGYQVGEPSSARIMIEP
jgi:hypothetical protein